MAQHTQGPWHACHTSKGTFEVFSKNNDEAAIYGRRHICDVLNDDVSDKANAALIAAAPEMLAFIEQQLRNSKDETDHHGRTTFNEEDAEALITRARGQ